MMTYPTDAASSSFVAGSCFARSASVVRSRSSMVMAFSSLVSPGIEAHAEKQRHRARPIGSPAWRAARRPPPVAGSRRDLLAGVAGNLHEELPMLVDDGPHAGVRGPAVCRDLDVEPQVVAAGETHRARVVLVLRDVARSDVELREP